MAASIHAVSLRWRRDTHISTPPSVHQKPALFAERWTPLEAPDDSGTLGRAVTVEDAKPMLDPMIGQLIRGYVIRQKLAEGGMGAVYQIGRASCRERV